MRTPRWRGLDSNHRFPVAKEVNPFGNRNRHGDDKSPPRSGSLSLVPIVELPFDTFTALGLGTVVVNLNINYRKEARLGQHLTVSTEPIRKGRTSFVLRHVIVNGNDELVADANVVSVTIDLKSRKASLLPNALVKMFG